MREKPARREKLARRASRDLVEVNEGMLRVTGVAKRYLEGEVS